MTDLAEFLLARIAEDETAARAAETRNGAAWTMRELLDGVRIDGTVKPGNPRQSDTELWDDEGAMGMWSETGTHVVRHDPARVLVDCGAKRRIIEEHENYDPNPSAAPGWPEYTGYCSTCGDVPHVGYPCDTLKLLALPFATHPEYDEEWRV